MRPQLVVVNLEYDRLAAVISDKANLGSHCYAHLVAPQNFAVGAAPLRRRFHGISLGRAPAAVNRRQWCFEYGVGMQVLLSDIPVFTSCCLS